MAARVPFLICLLGFAAAAVQAENRIFLNGWASFDGVSRALIVVLPENNQWLLRSDREVDGWRLEELDVLHGRARIRRGTESFLVTLPSAAKSDDTLAQFVRSGNLPADYSAAWPLGYEPEIIRVHRAGHLDLSFVADPQERGKPASGKYIGALRAYARNLPDSDKAIFDLELQRYSAPPLRPAETMPLSSASTQAVPPVAPKPAELVSESQNDDATLLKKLLSSLPPETGSLIGSGTDSEIGAIRKLLLAADDPMTQLRLRQQLEGYAAPPVAPYVRNAAGEWVDPKAGN